MLVVVFPLVCVLIILCSWLVALTAVLWMPALTLLIQVTNALIYDLDCPDQKRNRYFGLFEAVVGNILTLGCLQPLVALIVAGIICPVVAVVILAGMYFLFYLMVRADNVIEFLHAVLASYSTVLL